VTRSTLQSQSVLVRQFRQRPLENKIAVAQFVRAAKNPSNKSTPDLKSIAVTACPGVAGQVSSFGGRLWRMT
jgi:hypothetical protein